MIRNFSGGTIFSESFKIYLRHFVPLFLITAVCSLPLYVVSGYANATGLLVSQMAVWFPLTLLVAMLVYPLSTGAVTFAVYQSLRGKSPSIGESLSAAFGRFLPLLGVAICVSLFVTAGFFLLLIPGLMLMCLLFVATPVCVVEKKGVFESMQRSRKLTSGRKWQIFVVIFGIGLVMGILTQVVLLPVGGVGANGQPNTPLGLGVQFFMQTITTGWNAAAAALSYYYLRSINESVDIEDIANVFD